MSKVDIAFPVWFCVHGHVNDKLSAQCTYVQPTRLCSKPMPCSHSDGHCTACGELRYKHFVECEEGSTCSYVIESERCEDSRACDKCGTKEGVSLAAIGCYCKTCSVNPVVWTYSEDPPRILAGVQIPTEYAREVRQDDVVPRAVESFRKILIEGEVDHDIRVSRGPEPQQSVVFCVRARTDSVRLAILWRDARFWMALVRTRGGYESVNLAEAKRRLGFAVPERKASVRKPKEGTSTPKLKDSMR
jgi:hypothetical protein